MRYDNGDQAESGNDEPCWARLAGPYPGDTHSTTVFDG